jgi:hypothetical protein
LFLLYFRVSLYVTFIHFHSYFIPYFYFRFLFSLLSCLVLHILFLSSVFIQFLSVMILILSLQSVFYFPFCRETVLEKLTELSPS